MRRREDRGPQNHFAGVTTVKDTPLRLATLSTLGLPLEGVGLLLAIDPIIDMIRTATNVAGQALIPTIVAKRNRLLDQDVYDANTFGGADTRLELDEDEATVPAPDRDRDRVAVPA